MACTIAVEELIGQHYNDQIKALFEAGIDDADAKELLEVCLLSQTKFFS